MSDRLPEKGLGADNLWYCSAACRALGVCGEPDARARALCRWMIRRELDALDALRAKLARVVEVAEIAAGYIRNGRTMNDEHGILKILDAAVKDAEDKP